MADNVLGISGSLDINDIVKSIDRLYDEVGKIEGVSKKMAEELEKAYTAVGKASKEELEEKSKKALEVFSKAFEEAKTSADKNVTKIEASITRLQDKLAKVSVERSDTVTGTKTFDRLTRQMESLNTQIHNQQESLAIARENARVAGENYAEFLSKVEKTKSATDALNGLKAEQSFDGLTSAIEEATDAIEEDGKAAKKLGHDLDDTADKGVDGFKKLEKAAIGFFTIQKAEEFISKVFDVRSEIENLETSFRILVGNKDDADALFASIRKFAVETPMQLNDLASAAQTMMGFGIATEDVMENLKALGNAAMGDSQRFQSLALAFSQMSATGKLMGQDLLQMINAGFNPLDQMARTTGKSVADLKEEMSNGAISADMVRQAFIDATSEGGKFNGMLEAQSKTMAGAYSNLQGAIDDMLNEIGEKGEGIMKGAIDLASMLAKNYETVGRVIAGLIATYGTYKVAVMTVAAAEATLNGAYTLKIRLLRAAVAAQQLLNTTMLLNPYVAVATAIAAVTTALFSLGSEQDRVNAAYDEYIRKKDEAIAKEEEHKRKIDQLAQTAGDESLSTDTRRIALVQLEQQYPAIFAKYDTEIEKLKHIRDLNAEIAVLEGRKSVANAQNEMSELDKRIAELQKKGQWSLASTNSYAGTHTSSRSRAEEEELQALLKRRKELAKQIEKDRGDTYLANLTGVSNIDLQRQINERRNLLAQMDANDKKYGKVKIGGATGIYDRDALQGQLQTLEAEQNRRKKLLEDQSKDFVAEAEKAYKKEQAALKKLESLTDPIKRSKSDQTIDGKKVSEMGSDEFLAAIEKQQKAVEEAKKKVEAYNNAKNGGASTSKEEAATRQDAAIREKQFEQELAERERQSQQLEALKDAQSEAAIANEQNRAKREMLQVEKDHQDKLHAIDLMAEEMRKANYEAQKKVWEVSNTDKTKSWSDTDTAKAVQEKGNYSSIALTKEQDATLKALWEKENADYANIIKERFDAEKQSMLAYLQEYGTYQQQKLAIAEEYAKKIADAQAVGNNGEVLRLTAERDSKVAQANAQSLAMNIDWNQTFSGIGNVLQDIAQETLKKVNDYMTTAEFKALGADAKKAYSDLKKQLTEAGGQKASNPFSSSTWNEIARLTDEYKAHVKALADASEKNEKATKAWLDAVAKQTQAQANLKKAQSQQAAHLGKSDQSEYDTAVENAKKNLAIATEEVANTFQQMQESGEAVQQQQTNVSNTQQELHEKSDAATQGLNNFNTMLGQLTSGTLTGFVNGVSNVINALTKKTDDDMQGLIGVIGKKAGGIIGAILSIIDMLGDKPVEFFDSLFDGISKVIEAVISHIPEIIASVVKGVGNIIGGVITGIGGLFGVGVADNTAYEQALEKWGGILDAWESNVKYERELMEKAYGVKAIDYSRQALKALENAQKAAEEIYKGWASSGAGWFSHSHGYEDDRNTKWEYLWQYDEELAKQLGVTKTKGFLGADVYKGDVTKLFDLTWEQLEQLQNRAPQFWASMSDEARDYLSKFIEAGRTAQETLDALNEQLTTTTKENVFDDYLNSLYDLANGSEDVMESIAENWQKMVNRMVINNLIGSKVQSDLTNWYNDLAELNRQRTEGEIGDTAYANGLEALKARYDSIVQQGKDSIDQLTKEGIIKPIEEAVNEAKQNFESIRDAWVSTITDMKGDTEQLGKEIARIIFESLVASNVFDAEFDEWLQNWIDRYNKALSVQAPGERKSRLEQLEKERAAKVEELTNKTKEYADMVGYASDAVDEFSSSLDNLADTFLDVLLNMDEDAADIGKKIGSSLIREMMQQMLASEAYAERMSQIKEHWKKALNGEEGFTYESVMGEIAELNNDIAQDKALNALAEQWKALNKEVEQTKTSFSDVRDIFLDALLDVESDVETLRKKLEQTLVKDLVERQVLDVPLTVTIEGEDKVFDNFDKYSEDWNERYADAIKSGNTALADALIEEMMQVYGLTLEQAEKLRERLKKVAEDSTFKDMTGSWISSLMDFNATAEDWAKNVGRTMAQRIIEQMVAPTLMQPLLDSLQKAFDIALNAQGEGSVDWSAVINDESVQAALQAVKDAYPELKDTITQILAALNITPEAEKAKEAFSDLTGTIVSGLTDAEMTAEEFSKNIARTLTEQLIKSIVDSQFAETMKSIQDDWAKALEIGDASAIEAIRKRIVQLYEDAGRATDELRGIFEEVKEGDSTFKDMGDSLAEALSNLDTTAADFGRQIGQTLVNKLVKELVVSKKLQKYLDDIQTAFDNAIGKEGATIESVLAAVTPAINAAVAATEQWKPVIEEISKAFQEIDKSTPLDNIRSIFLSQLMDMKSDTKDFARSINEILTEAFIDRFVLGEEFDKRLEEWKNEYASIMGGKYTEEERANLLKQLRQTIVIAKEGYAAEAQAIHEFMGTANYSDQTATMNLSDKMTHEDADLLVNVNVSQLLVQQQILQAITGGNVTPIDAIQAAPYTSLAEMTSTSNTAKQILATLQSMQAVTNPDDNSLSEISNKFDTANERLLAILRSVQSIKEYVASNVAASRGILGRL